MPVHPPVAQQYINCKENHQDHLVFFQIGEFYEAMFDDAVTCSKLLNLTLTKRSQAQICGIPRSAKSMYVSRLLRQNKKVAFYEQADYYPEHQLNLDQIEKETTTTISNAISNTSKGPVKRTLSRIFTPGTITEEEFLTQQQNNFLIAIYSFDRKLHVAITDISVCELITKVISYTELETTLLEYNPSEILITLPESLDHPILEDYKDKLTIIPSESFSYSEPNPAVGALRNYIKQTKALEHFEFQAKQHTENTMFISKNSYANLELSNTLLGDKKGSLLSILDNTNTALGSRWLQRQLHSPLVSKTHINKRLDCIEFFLSHPLLAHKIHTQLENITDIQRSCYRIINNREKKIDYVRVLESLKALQNIYKLIERETNQSDAIPYLSSLPLSLFSLLEFIENNIITPSDPNGSLIANNPQFISILQAHNALMQQIKTLELKYRAETNTNLKIKIQSNEHFIEVNNKDSIKIGYSYQLKQNLSTTKRYSTIELDEINIQLTILEQNMINLEQNILLSIKEQIKANQAALFCAYEFIAKLDVFIGFARTAYAQKLTRPNFCDQVHLQIQDGWHLAIKARSNAQNQFQCNDCNLTDNKVIFLTGANMSGKSTYMRQNAQIVLLAQIGCFVPAKSAVMNISDAIYTRIGAYDDISKGKSTFMCEMEELSEILSNATNKSLIILDEIGRGTSPQEGQAIAQATLEELINIGVRTIFATHFHGIKHTLNVNFKKMESIYRVNQPHTIKHTHKLIDGISDHSYGIITAEQAGIKSTVTARAWKIYDHLMLK